MYLLKTKRTLLEFLWAGTLLFAFTGILLRPAAAAEGALRGLAVCYGSILPALFPFLVLSGLLLKSRAAGLFGMPLRPFTRLLGIRSTKASAALLCGILGGFASGAKAVDTLYQSNELTSDEASLLLICTIGSGPGFVVNSVGAQMLGSAGTGWLLLASQLCASLICGIAVRLCMHRPNKKPPSSRKPFTPIRTSSETAPAALSLAKSASACAGAASLSLTEEFVFAVQDAVSTTLTLCGYVTFFSFFAAIAVPSGSSASLRFRALLLLEVTGACRAACETGSTLRTQLCCAALSIMGVSVFLQLRTLLSVRISLVPLTLSRLIQLPLALLFLQLLTAAFSPVVAVSAPFDRMFLPAVRMPPDVMLVVFTMAALACGGLPVPHRLRGRKKEV